MKNNLNTSQKLHMAHQAIQRINQGQTERRDGQACPPPFMFSTENLSDSYNFLDFQDKTFLTIGGSGDHAFEAYARGARHVTQFDRNILQESVTRLKFELIKRMKYSQFMQYFFGTLMKLKPIESYKIIQPFMPSLSPLAQQFLHSYYTSPNQYFFMYFEPFYDLDNYRTDKISYIKSESNYDLLKKRLPADVDFLIGDLEQVSANIRQKYDIVHLSNVLTSDRMLNQSKNFYKEKLNSFSKNIAQPIIQNNCTDNGTLIFSYLWGTDINDKENAMNIILMDEFENAKTPNMECKIQHFESVKKPLIKDAILTINKTR